MNPLEIMRKMQLQSALLNNKINPSLLFKYPDSMKRKLTDYKTQQLNQPNAWCLQKDNTWTVPNCPVNKQVLTQKSICNEFVSTAFYMIAAERFMKVEKLGSTNAFGENRINSFAA